LTGPNCVDGGHFDYLSLFQFAFSLYQQQGAQNGGHGVAGKRWLENRPRSQKFAD
jgi:hypothetical protein